MRSATSPEVEMNEDEQTARWQDLMDARADFGDQVVPLRAAQNGARRRHPSRKLALFDEALSGWANWSSVDKPRRRLSA
jgi:hypothetical protein